MKLSIELTEVGYVVLNDGAAWLTVNCNPDTGLPFDDKEAAQAHGDAFLACWESATQEIAPTEATPQ